MRCTPAETLRCGPDEQEGEQKRRESAGRTIAYASLSCIAVVTDYRLGDWLCSMVLPC
jgi:hypothetical protein